eukprot:11187665-Lingulodinium_polyedra.AAC.1
MRKPVLGAHVECTSVQSVSRCGNEQSIRPHHCATRQKRCAMMRSRRPSAAATARKPHARAHNAQASFWPALRTRQRAP